MRGAMCPECKEIGGGHDALCPYAPAPREEGDEREPYDRDEASRDPYGGDGPDD